LFGKFQQIALKIEAFSNNFPRSLTPARESRRTPRFPKIREEMMEWKDSYDIGIESIDKQHRQMVDMISRLEISVATDTENREMGNALKFLVDYINMHFSEEEEIMRKSGFPRYEHQKALHKGLIQKVMAVLLKLKKGESIHPQELIGFLTDWLVTHILDEDQKIGEFLAEKERSTAKKETISTQATEPKILKKG
jgi:hemerythrin